MVPQPFVVAASEPSQKAVEDDGKSRYVWQMDKSMPSDLAAIKPGKHVLETAPWPEGAVVGVRFPLDSQEPAAPQSTVVTKSREGLREWQR